MPSPPEPLIDARGMTAGYQKGRDVLKELSFTLAPGLVHGLIGPNGAGKTTLLRVLAGQLRHHGGVQVFGTDPFDNPAVMDRTVLAGIDAPLPGDWTVRKLLAVGKARYSGWDRERAAQLVELFGLPETRRYSALSRGQKSATSLVLACASGCELLLLDEPYLGLDVERRREFYLLLREERERVPRTIILSTHHLHEAEKLLDTVLFIRDGSVRVNGPAQDIAERILAIVGPADDVDRVLGSLGPVSELRREEMPTGCRSIIDLRGQPALAEVAYDTARQVSGRVRVSEVTLE